MISLRLSIQGTGRWDVESPKDCSRNFAVDQPVDGHGLTFAQLDFNRAGGRDRDPDASF